jgi:hypothetical protein
MSIYVCNECNDAAFQHWRRQNEDKFPLNKDEVKYLVDNIQHEYLSKDTYYFASDLFGRMQRFLDELVRRDSKTT